MSVEFLHADPNRRLSDRLRGWLATATRFDLVVAFLTHRGADLLIQYLDCQRDHVAIAVSVRFPTNFDALAKLHERWPGRVFIHLGYRAPQEEYGDRAQMHSKVVLMDDADGTVRAVVGSHNWTATGLDGQNGEASLLLIDAETSPAMIDIRAHITETLQGCEVFDPERIDFYREIQSRLHRGPAAADTMVDFAGYHQFPALILHAEAARADLLAEQSLLLYLPFSAKPDIALTVGTVMHLYLYPTGALSTGRPTTTPQFFAGTLQTLNSVSTGGLRERRIDSAVANLRYPVVDRATSIPISQNVGFEIVADLVSKEMCEPLVYHSGKARPGVRVDIEWITVEAPGQNPGRSSRDIQEYFRGGLDWVRPGGETEHVSLRVPRAEYAYARNPYLRIAEQLGDRRGAAGLRQLAQSGLGLDPRRVTSWETDYFYMAQGWLVEAEL
jgi:hypothetical protein